MPPALKPFHDHSGFNVVYNQCFTHIHFVMNACLVYKPGRCRRILHNIRCISSTGIELRFLCYAFVLRKLSTVIFKFLKSVTAQSTANFAEAACCKCSCRTLSLSCSCVMLQDRCMIPATWASSPSSALTGAPYNSLCSSKNTFDAATVGQSTADPFEAASNAAVTAL